jgi:hypothetical protein
MKSISSAKYIFLVIFTIVSVYGCNSSSYKKEVIKEKSSGENFNQYFPVAEGNKWEYINQAPREETEQFKVEITGVKYDGKDQIVEFNSFPFFSKKDEKTNLKIKPDGEIYLMNTSSGKEELFIPETSKFKKEYSWQFGEWTGIIGGTNDTVKTETGTYYNCIFLNFSIFYTFAAEVWVAKDKGIVKWGYFRTNPPTLNPQYYVLNKLNLVK